MIAGMLLTLVVVIVIIRLFRRQEKYYLLEEMVPHGQIVSLEEGIVDYDGVQFIFGTNDLKHRKQLIKSLNLLDLEGPCVIDMRFNTQVIVRGGSDFKTEKSDPKSIQ